INVYGNLRNYQHDRGDNLYRRSLYTIWKRTAAPPSMALFDVPGREMCRVRRSRTNTPLPAPGLMNDVTLVEPALVFAQHTLTEGGATPDQRIAYASHRAVGRPPTTEESRILAAGLQARLARYRANPEAAKQLIHLGDSLPDSKLDAGELAA